MEETITFKITDQSGADTRAELMVNPETDVFELSVAREEVMSGMWSSNLQKVFQRALEMWNVEPEIDEIENEQ